MSESIHAAIIDRIKDLTTLADSYQNAANLIIKIKNLEVELKLPNAKVIDREEKERRLEILKAQFNDTQIIHLFSKQL